MPCLSTGGGGFRVSAGMLKNNGAAEGSSTLQGAIVIDGQNLDSTDLNGDIGTEVSLGESYQPCFGIGWGRGAGDGGGFSYSLDVGVALLDTSVDFDATVNAGGTNALNQPNWTVFCVPGKRCRSRTRRL